MAKVLFPSSSSPGIRPNEGGGRLLNCYAEKLSAGAPAEYIIRRAPGLERFATQATAGYRGGMLALGDLFFAVSGSLQRTDSDGVVTTVGALAGSLPVTFARNNKTPTPDNVVVTQNGAFTFTPASVTTLVEPNLPQPNSVTFLDSFFFFSIADGRCFASGINDTTVSSVDFVNTEAKSDGLVRAVAYDRDLYLMGEKTIEVFGGEINAVGFPFNRVAVIPRGLLAATAVAGWEDGFGSGLLWVADDHRVHKLVGYGSQPVSPPELDNLIEDLTPEQHVELDACVYVIGGHPCWVLSGPTFTWVHDLTPQYNNWHERASYLGQRWRLKGNIVQAFGGKWIGGDTESGNLMHVSKTAYEEDGDPLVFQVDSIAMEAFSQRVRVPLVDFNFDRGEGLLLGRDPVERNPHVEVSWSDDGGSNYSTPLLRPLGPYAVTKGLVRVARTGLSGPQGRRWRLTVSDPVYVGLLVGEMQAEARAA